MDILDGLLDLLAGETVGPPRDWENMASETEGPCHNYKLVGTSTCNGVTNKTLYLEIPAFEPVRYKKKVEGYEDGNNQPVPTWTYREPVVVFSIIADAAVHNTLEIIAAHCLGGTVEFSKLSGGPAASIKSVNITPSLDEELTRLEVELEFKNAGLITSICCGSYYNDAPFNECDGEGETGDPSNDPVCVDFLVSIDYTTGPELLTASVTGGGPGVPLYTWTLNGVPFGTGASVVPTLPGVYKVQANLGNCTAVAEITYNTPCSDFEVLTQLIELGDGSFVIVALPNLAYTSLQWQEYIDGEWTDIVGETDLLFQPGASGTYRVTGVAIGGCTDESDGVVVEIPEDICDGLFSVEVSQDGDDITAELVDYAGEGVPTFQWWLDTGGGSQPLAEETGATIEGAGFGYYTVLVTVDGCSKAGTILVGCTPVAEDCDCPGSEDWYQEFAGPGDSFVVTNFALPDPAVVSAVQIMAAYEVTRNGQVLYYVDPPTALLHWAIDYANQEIVLAAAFPLEAGDVLGVRKLKWIQI